MLTYTTYSPTLFCAPFETPHLQRLSIHILLILKLFHMHKLTSILGFEFAQMVTIYCHCNLSETQQK